MKQVLQSLKSGVTEIADVPVPSIANGSLLIETSRTLVSVGTERMLVNFGKSGWINKARTQPDKVRLVVEKIKTDGLKPTLDTVLNKLDQPLPLGYCNVGSVSDVGFGVKGFKIGDRVVSNGKHAEVVNVPINLCAKVPDNVSNDEAAFTILGAIALQSIRLVKPTLGEAIIVTGLGLVGLLTVQLLRANGCRVLGIDYDQSKLALAREFGAETVDLSAGQDPVTMANKFSRGRGADAVIIAASTQSSEPMHQAAMMCRKRGRIVLVGVTGLELSRDDFFSKEITFQVSASYGPGRYDPNYEEKGQDYPVGFVRWTEQRNFEAILDMISLGFLDVKKLISHEFDISDAEQAYDLISKSQFTLGILLKYPGIKINAKSQTIKFDDSIKYPNFVENKPQTRARISFLGSGNYASSILLPAFKSAGAEMRIIASNTGVSGFHLGKKYGFLKTTTESDILFNDPQTDAIVVATRHDSHSKFVLKALCAKKHIFVEKPLCLNLEELSEIKKNYTGNSLLMVGFNRRFSPHVQKIKNLLQSVSGPKAMVMTINAGEIPADNWQHDPELGGGRIIGEMCHFIDLLRFLTGEKIISFDKICTNTTAQDTVTTHFLFSEGSIGTIHYFANGSKSYPKERLEIFADGKVLKLDNYIKLEGFGWPGFKKMNLWRQDKGQKACVKSFIDALTKGHSAPIPFEEIIEVSNVSIGLSKKSV